MEVLNKRRGITNCLRLHILSEPNPKSEVVCKVRYLTEVVVDLDNSTEDFYKIQIAVGAEGYAQKEYITLR